MNNAPQHFTLRDYQQDAVEGFFSYFKRVDDSGFPIIEAPTGSGKSLIIAEIIRRLQEEWGECRIIVSAHVKELVEQNSDKLIKIKPNADIGIFSASLKKKQYDNQIIYGSIQTMYNKAEKIGFVDLLIIDECHLTPVTESSSYRKFIRALQKINPELMVLGLTATPYRLHGGCLITGKSPMFKDFCYKIPIKKLLDDGYLSYVTTGNSFDASEGLGIIRGEFDEHEMQQRMIQIELIDQYLPLILTHKEQRKSWLMFCSGIEHCYMMQEALLKENINCAVITGETKQDERDRLLQSFRNGQIQCMINDRVLTTGTDVPCIDMIILLRATMSPGLYVQMVGRGMRLSPETGKNDCLLLDFGGNMGRFGPIESIRPPMVGDGSSSKDAPEKICPECEAVNHAARKSCTVCGYEFSPPPKEIEAKPASGDPILAQTSKPELRKVDAMFFDKHYKGGDESLIPTLKITYSSGLDSFAQYLPVISDEPMKRRFGISRLAKLAKVPYWKEVIDINDIDEIIAKKDEIFHMPSHAQVVRNGKYWNVRDIKFEYEIEMENENV